jgi:Sec-independent protein translocase protein TatA
MFGQISLPMLVFIFVVALIIFGPRAFGARGPF